MAYADDARKFFCLAASDLILNLNEFSTLLSFSDCNLDCQMQSGGCAIKLLIQFHCSGSPSLPNLQSEAINMTTVSTGISSVP